MTTETDPPRVCRVARNCRGSEYEDDSHAREQDIQGDFVRRLLPLRAFDERDHAIEERVALSRRDADADPIGKNLSATGDGRSVAARLADDRSRFTRDCRLIDGCNAFDDFTIRRNNVPRLNQDNVPGLQTCPRHQFEVLVICAGEQLGLGLRTCPPQRIGLSLASSFGDSLGKVGEQDGDPQPDDNLEGEAEISPAVRQVANEDDRRQQCDDLDHEHDRISDQRPWIEFREGRPDRRPNDLRIENCRHRRIFCVTW